jgi:hypothetical protein
MTESTKDYYDIPTEWIPSSNFANRPMGEITGISLMDGLWTFICPSDSSSSSEAGNNSTPRPRDAAKLLYSEVDSTREAATTLAGSSSGASLQKPRGLSKDMKKLEGRTILKKAASAPPGPLSMGQAYTPEPPRRVVSARSGSSEAVGRNAPQPTRLVLDSLVGSCDIDCTKLQGRLQTPLCLGSNRCLQGDARLPSSFSQKARVKKTLEKKDIVKLKTDIVDFESRGLLSSPVSMLNTPRELYAIPEKYATSEDLCSLSNPYAKDARRSIISSLSGTASSLYLGKTRRRKSLHDNHGNDTHLAGRLPIYLPGEICLEGHPAKLRKDSVASLDPFAKEVEPRGKRYSDMIILDSITKYFDELGVMEDETECCFDRYWLDAYRASCRSVDSRESSSTSVEEPPFRKPERPRSERIVQGSRFSFSSASSSSSSLPRSGTPMRQRDKLKRLLSPAFPGSAFLRTPASWGQQAETS